MNFQDFKNKYQKKEPEEFPHRVNSQPTLSVLVQTFQQNKYIQKCLDGILNQQTDFPFEILLGEDSSTDGTRNICIEYAEKYPEKIRLFLHHPENKIKVLGTTTGNFNAFYNFYQAKANFIAFCEGDDLWGDPLKLQKQVDFLEENRKFVLCFHNYIIVDETTSILDDSNFPEKPISNISSENLKEVNFHPLLSTVIFRKEFHTIPREALQIINVDTFIISLLGSSGSGKYMDKIKPSYYRIHKHGVWSKRAKTAKYKNKINTYRQLYRYYKRIGDPVTSRSFSKKVKLHIKMAAFNYLKTGNIIGFLKMIKFLK
ncbi:glycosyltransferase [Salinimicrobium sp. TIG7-5_MAKvit]|uniref:glycosyltransferase n=1 Tax=Salinimicrobium sp. TIG7-5_MAKvit TaxID=3121289 RepID=UPI003C6DBFD2